MSDSEFGPFDGIASDYDGWYDAPEGAKVLAEELECLRLIIPEIRGCWLEIGVGTGRFASILGISHGLDPSPSMLAIAASRGIRTHVGVAEDLPFADRSLDGVLMVATLCFVTNPSRALSECARVLRTGGTLLIGHIPSDGWWGREYTRKAGEEHPVYSHARFVTVDELVSTTAAAGFRLEDAASALFWTPGIVPAKFPRLEHRLVPGAGFVALKLRSPIP